MNAETEPATRAPIGTHGLRGAVVGNFVTIAGPCGQGQTMSRAAAAELRDWLIAQTLAD
jgi:hypothetical protein